MLVKMTRCMKTPIRSICVAVTAVLFCLGVFLTLGSTRTAFVSLNPTNKDSFQTQISSDIDSTKITIEETGEYAETERRQQKTQENIRKYCQKYDGNLTFPKLENLFAIDSPPLLYCLMPKSASRQWRGLLSRLNNRKRLSNPQFNATDVDHYFSKSYKFTFVREPFERLLSAYKDKFISRRAFDRSLLKYYGTKILHHFRPKVTKQSMEALDDITFPEFVEYIIKEGVHEGFDRHWNTYEEQCNPCLIKYDFIGRYEFLAEDGNYMLEKAGENRVQFPKEKPFDTRSELLSYYSKIPLEWILELGRVYRSNFEMFGYAFPGPLEPLFQNATRSKAPKDSTKK